MADENIIGIVMQLDVSDLKSGLAEVNKEIKKSKDDFTVATASMDNWGKSVDGLTAKISQLNTQLTAQAKAVAGYKAEIERVSKLEGNHTATLDRLRTKLAQAEKSFAITKGQITKYENALRQVNKANISATINTARTALSKFGNELKKVTKAQLAQNVAMLANPYALVASAIGLLIGLLAKFIQKKREEREVHRETVEEVKELKAAYEDYEATLNSAMTAVTTHAKSYSDSIQQSINLREAVAKLKKEWSDPSLAVNYLQFLEEQRDLLKEVRKTYGETSAEYQEGQKIYRSLLTDLVLLNAKLLESGETEQQIKKFMSDIGVSAEDAAAAFQLAKKGVDEFTAASQKSQKKDTKPVEFYSTTQLAEDKKHYEEWVKLREAREYKLVKFQSDNEAELTALSKTERDKRLAAEVSAIDAEIAKHEDGTKSYLQYQLKMKLAAEGTAEDIGKTTDKIADKGEDAAKKFVEAWKSALPGINMSLQQIFGTLDSLAKQVQDTVNSVIDAVSAYWKNYYDERKKELEESAEAETEQREHDLSEIERQYMNYEITLDEFKAKKAEIEKDITDQEGTQEDERARKKEELEREEDQRNREIFEAQKATDIAMLWIQSSIGQVTALVNAIRDLGYPAGPIVGGITAGLILTQTIAETVAMASQQYVSAFAKGGIVDRPTLGLVGEAGKEAIMPLENNTEWITELAGKIAYLQRTDFAAGIGSGNNYNYGGDTINNNRSNYNYTQNIYAPTTPSRMDLYRDGQRLLRLSRI